MVMMTDQARRCNPSFKVSLEIDNEVIGTSKSEKMLGFIIHQNIKWTEHIQVNEESLIKYLKKRIYGLYQISKVANFKTRKMVAEGIFMSKLIYLMPLWGGCELFLIMIKVDSFRWLTSGVSNSRPGGQIRPVTSFSAAPANSLQRI